MIAKILEKVGISNNLKDLIDAISNNRDCSVFGLNFAEKSLVLDAFGKKIIFVTTNFENATNLKKQFESLNKKVFVCFAGKFEISTNSLEKNEVYVNLLNALIKLVKNELDVLIISPDTLMQTLPNKDVFTKNLLFFKKGKNYDFNQTILKFNKLGYLRCDMVLSQGDFSVRGDIIDVFPFSSEVPIRLNFFDDELESIKSFDVATYLSNQEFEEYEVFPCGLTFIEDFDKIVNDIRKIWKKDEKNLSEVSKVRLNSLCEELCLNLENKKYVSSSTWLFPFLNYKDNILSYVNESTLIVFDDVKQIYDKMQQNYIEFEQSQKILSSGGEILSIHQNFCLPQKEIFKSELTKLSFQQITTNNRVFEPKEVFSFKCSNLTNFYGKYDLLKEELDYYNEYKYTTVIYAKDSETATYLEKYLRNNNLDCKLINNESLLEKNKVNIISKYLFKGAIFLEEKLCIIGSTELLGKSDNKQIKSKNKRDVFVLPKENDYVVHEIYGIGICRGIQRLKFTGYEKDYIIIEYDKGDKLYLPTEQVDLISTYVSGSETKKLNRLGSQDFIKTKQKVKLSVKEMAFDLMKLYASREHSKGFKFVEDDMLTKEFEDAFPFEETEDQLSAINDIKRDMTSEKIMDRLVCGDVGYGKTEVAIRAIFKAVQSGKQVAFLAPTTILSQQHYANCKTRLGPFMCNVEVLNRFKSTKEQKQILHDLKEGKIDVICGTHRLLSKDVQFKDLGLLVLDEEQRFGVQDKEKIKNLKNDIDVLTLSATPIPRTLHMSMSGIRDISLITTPPTGRLPIQTTVTEFSFSLIKDAINRELLRGGQALIVYNNVENIYKFAEKIRNLLENEINVGVAHGQMDKKLLESAVLDLYNGTTQILVSTTLIENGIDLPNANTIIVVDADKLGLSQLYQLKGRVGRSRTLGYAYFLYDKDKVLREDAYKRLNAIMEYTELGSGFKIALKDLEIRGCGNIMGKEQHGHMQKVGYDLYCKLLNESIKEIKGEKIKLNREVKIDVTLSCFIPNTYIEDSDNRFRVYNNMISIKNEAERINTLKEIGDVYGSVPVEVSNLSKIALMRNLSQSLGVKRIQINSGSVSIEFYSANELTDNKIDIALKNIRKQYFITTKEKFVLSFIFNNESIEEKVDFVIKFLINANNQEKI